MKAAQSVKRSEDNDSRTNQYSAHIDTLLNFLELEYGVHVSFERNADTALFHEKRGIVPGDFIVVNNRVTKQKQLYLLLHEIGHVLLRECEREHQRRFPAATLKGKYATRAHKIDTLREEVLAWEKAREVAADFQIPIDDSMWHSMVTSALYKYLEWSKNA